MEAALEKIRPHTSSTLSHQKAPAILLRALEATFEEQKVEKTPTAYFAAILTTIDGTVQRNEVSFGDGDVLPAELYLLALVIPFVSSPVVSSNLDTILTLTSPLFPALIQNSPPLRSQLSIYQCALKSLDRTQLDAQGVRQSFASILQLCLDPRPKVRKKAADVVQVVLSAPPTPLARHPYAEKVGDWVKSALNEANNGVLPRSKSNKASQGYSSETSIHLLAFLRPVLPFLPPSLLPEFTTQLLSLPRLGNSYLSQSAYSILSDVFSTPAESEESTITSQIPSVLKAILASPPLKTDTALSPSWLQLVGSVMLSFSVTDPTSASGELAKVWKTVWGYLESTDAAIKKASAVSLDLLAQSFTPEVIEPAINEAGQPDSKSTLNRIISQISTSLNSLSYSRAIPEMMAVISSLLDTLGRKDRSVNSQSPAEILLLPLVQQVGDLRLQKGFEYKEAAEATLSTAMCVLGPEVLLRILPLNLEPVDREAGREPRAFLLPLLAYPHPSPLTHFVSYFVPLSERMFDLQQKAEMDGRQSEAKVWTVLISQIWSGLSSYCNADPDVKKALSPEFSQLLSQLLYGQPELRPAILRSLKVLVESNLDFLSPIDDSGTENQTITKAEAKENIEFLKTLVESWLAVLFNVFGSVNRDGRGMVGDVISAWLAISSEKDTAMAFQKVLLLFKQNLAQPQRPPIHTGNPSEGGSIVAMSQDLLILLLPHLSPADSLATFETCLTAEVLCNKDNGVQKRGYKILSKVLEEGKVSVDSEAVIRRLDELSDGLLPAAKKDRFTLITQLVARLPPTALHLVPSLIPEVILGLKEPSEKARTAAFDTVVAMGWKMSEGGVVKRNLMDGMDEDEEMEDKEVSASIEEFMTMVAGGLAGASPHMISATVTALSRLVFEFKDSISAKMHTDIFTTLAVFLKSNNREIVKSVLGFIKLAVHTLPADLVRPHLKELVPSLLGWSHDHKNHFKAKVRHIFERMLRRFSWDEVYSCAGEGDSAKVLVNIKKRKENAKRRKARADEDGDGDEEHTTKPTTGDAFEDVLYGSESDVDDSDDDQSRTAPSSQPKKKGLQAGSRLRVDDDEPMDLLQGSASRILNSSGKRRKPGQDASRFKTDQDTGKIMIHEKSDSDDAMDAVPRTEIAGSAYKESITSVDGFTRTPGGRVKFNKDTKKRRREHENLEDVEMTDADAGPGEKGKKNKRRLEHKFGHEFKAKKAGGDIKRGGVDPYAYMSLSQASKKKGSSRGERLWIASKK